MNRPFLSKHSALLLASSLLLPGGCGDPASSELEPPSLTLVSTSGPVPYSENHSIAVVSRDQVCMIDSYESRVLCGDGKWSEVLSLGGAGDGPGEFRSPSLVIRGRDRTVGVVDVQLSRLTVFDMAGQMHSTTRIPFIFRPMASFDSVISGTFQTPQANPAGAGYARVSIPSGTRSSETTLLHPREIGQRIEAARGLSHGAESADGELAFVTGTHEVVRYDHEGSLIDVIAAPPYGAERPGPRDIEEFRARSLFGRLPSESEVEAFAGQPKRYARPARSLAFDERGRLWVMTQRDREEFSWLDVYEQSTFLGSVRVNDRIYGFDLYEDLLVVLVERASPTPEGLPLRAIDTYAIR